MEINAGWEEGNRGKREMRVTELALSRCWWICLKDIWIYSRETEKKVTSQLSGPVTG